MVMANKDFRLRYFMLKSPVKHLGVQSQKEKHLSAEPTTSPHFHLTFLSKIDLLVVCKWWVLK